MTAAAGFDASEAGASRHAYPASAMIGDYLRAAAGLVPAAVLFATVPLASVAAALLAAFAAIFGLFGVRTALRHGTRLDLTDSELRAYGILRRTIRWSELDRMRLAFYSTRRDRKSGWMQLQLRAGAARVTLDSRIAGFHLLVQRAAEAAVARDLELSDATLANLDALGVRFPELPPPRPGPARHRAGT
ncbi:MAG TPA: hypothetical protein VFX06_13960 [Stellaceae bacterium]|nr:hypothetical protein [Stellaceae bacterium]